jgi:hypothetical protein
MESASENSLVIATTHVKIYGYDDGEVKRQPTKRLRNPEVADKESSPSSANRCRCRGKPVVNGVVCQVENLLGCRQVRCTNDVFQKQV